MGRRAVRVTCSRNHKDARAPCRRPVAHHTLRPTQHTWVTTYQNQMKLHRLPTWPLMTVRLLMCHRFMAQEEASDSGVGPWPPGPWEVPLKLVFKGCTGGMVHNTTGNTGLALRLGSQHTQWPLHLSDTHFRHCCGLVPTRGPQLPGVPPPKLPDAYCHRLTSASRSHSVSLALLPYSWAVP